MGLEPTTSAVTGRRSNQLNYQAEYCAELFLRTIPHHFGGNNRARTYDPLLVRQMLSQLSYAPTFFRLLRFRFVYLSNRLLYYTLILWICQVFFQNFQKNFEKPANGSVTQFMVYYIRLYSKKFRIGENFFFRCGDLLYFTLQTQTHREQ